MSGLPGDVKYALRSLMARPLFVLVAALSLGLGIGVNTAIYSLYHQVVLRPLPVPQAEGLINLSAPGPKQGSTSNNGAGSRDDIFSYPMFRDLERHAAGSDGELVGVAAHRYLAADVVYDKQTRSGTAMLVSGDYFRLLQLQPTLGRLLDRNDDAAVGAAPVAVLSHAYWRNELGAAADVVNRSLRVNGQSLNIVGVAPEGFSGTTFGANTDVFVPITQRWQLQPQASRDEKTEAAIGSTCSPD
jgi:putative ABC transport system permease protein